MHARDLQKARRCQSSAETTEGTEGNQEECGNASFSVTIGLSWRRPRGSPLRAAIPGFDLESALHSLDITRTPFDEINGNVQGFARQREIAVSPIAALPLKTTLHEIAHVVLGHTTTQKLVDLEHIDRHIREVEAETVALICCESLGLPGAEAARGYIQHRRRAKRNSQSGRSADFCAAQTILKARGFEGGEPVGSPSCPFLAYRQGTLLDKKDEGTTTYEIT